MPHFDLGVAQLAPLPGRGGGLRGQGGNAALPGPRLEDPHDARCRVNAKDVEDLGHKEQIRAAD